MRNDLNKWTSDELLAEVLNRSVGDRPALRLVEEMIIWARLAESDRNFPGPLLLPVS